MNESAPFTPEELARYSRHLVLPEFGIQGQEKLKKSKVLVVGAGGLGAPVLQYLTAAGVGTIGIVEFDLVDFSNLQRQVLFNTGDVGDSKLNVAIRRLEEQNPNVQLVGHPAKLDSSNALDILCKYDVIVDGTDNFATRYLINDACVLLGLPSVHGAIFRFEGQVSVFNHRGGPTYRDLFPTPPPPDMAPNCAEGGVLGVLPGIIGSIQANEVIKILTGIGELLSGKLFVFDALTLENRILRIPKQEPQIEISELIDYEQFCGLLSNPVIMNVKEITVEELKKKIDQNEDFQLVDVREPHEVQIATIGGDLIPLGQVMGRSDEFDTNREVVVYCRSGKRSADAIMMLEEIGFENLFNLKGGILDWADKIDPSVRKY